MSRPSSAANRKIVQESPEHERSFSEHDQSQESPEEPWKALSAIIRDTGPTLSVDEELEDLSAAEAAVVAKDQEREAVIDQMRDDLRQLSRQLQQASTEAQRPASHPSSAEHEAQVRSLEQEQYTTMKQLNEEQGLAAKKEVELSKWRAMRDDVDKIQVGEKLDDGWANGKIIRLKLLSEAGFSLVPSKDGSHSNKIMIRNDAKEDVHSVPIDKSRSKVYNANLIWSLASDS
ncbi:hypothetical protein IAT40_001392 [Kwoniella sp. CBS 6097]